jgi:hypothetical protein
MGKVFLIFGAIIVSQILIWRAVVAVQNEIVTLEYAVSQPPCGGSNYISRPCHVVIDKQ